MTLIKNIVVEAGQLNSPMARQVGAEKTVSAVEQAPRTKDYRDGKKIAVITGKKGDVFGSCASMSQEYICCNVKVLSSVSNCPFDCSYCFLQNYLTNTTTMMIADMDAIVAEVEEKTAAEPWRFFRIGNWELGDSLALEPDIASAAQLIKAFRPLKQCVLELKTKSDYVDNLLDLDHDGRVVIAWSMNPQAVIGAEELKTASLERRLKAMERVVAAGYMVAVHFDPMILHEGWQKGYQEVAQSIYEVVPPQRMAWLSIGSLRFNPEMKKAMESNFPRSRITSEEMVLGGDGKMRYVKPVRTEMYRLLYEALRRYGGDDPLIYLCMERRDMWEKVFGYSPCSIGHLDYIMSESLQRRFPGLVHEQPQRELYDPH
ncbi:MAG: hypothetical protein GXP10_01840 [Gammaproteobacteria bacterium]|nr:hypothetical protein [Gammaproteobacteria bacterium]